MNSGYIDILKASPADRRNLFLSAAGRIGTPEQNVEKDFWVCWTLDAVFNRLPRGGPRLLFKGGTSLSKAYGLISRFSEDIDITVFRGDLGQEASVEELEALSGKKRRARLDAIKAACRGFIQGPLLLHLSGIAEATMLASGIDSALMRVEVDCSRHARMFFGSPDLGLDAACRGSFTLAPAEAMLDDLRRDYGRMAGMIIGEIPRFEDVIDSIRELELRLNTGR